MYDCIVLGNPCYNSIATPEITTSGRILSGPAVNISQTIAKLNVTEMAIVGAVGSDFKKRFSVDVDHLGIPEYYAIDSKTTNGFHIYCDEGGAPTLRLLDAAKVLGIRDIPEEFLQAKQIVLAPGYREINSELVEWISTSSDSKIILDVQGMTYRQNAEGNLVIKPDASDIRKALKFVDIVKMERSVWRIITDESDPLLAAEFVLEAGPQVGILMLSSMGAVVYDNSDFYIIPFEKNDRRNVLGASDAFLGAFAVGLMNENSILEQSALASSAASIVIESSCSDFKLYMEDLERRKRIINERITVK